MVKRIGSSRRKTKLHFTKPKSMKGKYPIQGLIQSFKDGDSVLLKAEASIHKGLYFRRFHGKTGTIIGKKGRAYEVCVMDGGKCKTLIVNPVHLRRI